jgi:hypothetical protein
MMTLFLTLSTIEIWGFKSNGGNCANRKHLAGPQVELLNAPTASILSADMVLNIF